MPITMLDARTALIVIDLQKGIVSLPVAHPIGPVVENAARLAAAFRGRGLPVVLVNVAGTPPGRIEAAPRLRDRPPGWDELVPALNRQPGDHLVTKRTRGAFVRTDLEVYLNDHGVTQVVIVGVATSAGVEATALAAFELGFNVVLARDAMTDLSEEVHDYSLTRTLPRLGEIGTTQDILALLEARG